MTVYKINPALIGKGSPVIDRNSPNNYRVYNGIEGSFMARLHGGAQVFGGFLVARQICEHCAIRRTGPATITFAQASDPNYTLYCDQTQFDIPFRTQFKFGGTYPLPYQIQRERDVPELSGHAELRLGRDALRLPAADLHRPRCVADAGTGVGNNQPEHAGQLVPAAIESARSALRAQVHAPGRQGHLAAPGGSVQRAELASGRGGGDQLGTALGQATAALQPRILTLGAQLHF